MKKYFIFAAIAAIVMSASCAKNETFVKMTDQDAVFFGAYSGRTITKAGPTDDMNLDALKQHGFGVFATYTGTDAFEDDAIAGATDDFMYNQKVAFDTTTTSWVYSPIKYWPNPTNGQAADDQKVSFFAYAPYADPGAAEIYGVTGFSKAVALDNPADPADTTKHVHDFVHYTFSKDSANVDLMWGYKAKDTSTDPVTYTINNNLTRTTDKIRFVFQHLFAKLGGSQEDTGVVYTTDPVDPYSDPAYVANGLVVKANPVSLDPTNGFGSNNGTKITISKIVIASAPEKDDTDGDGIGDTDVTDIDGNKIVYAKNDITGKLDLYTGVYKPDTTAMIQFSQTITNMVDDPATPEDESSATENSELADYLKEPATFTTWTDLTVKGVVEKALNVYKDESNPIILMPGTKPVVDVTLTYTVRTYDEKLGTVKCSQVPQTVFGRIKFAEIKKNTKYNIVMIIGLNDVKLEAVVEDWTKGTVTKQVWVDEDGDGVVDPGEMKDTTVNDTEIGLPYNL